MSPAEIIYTLIIGPLKLLFEVIYSCTYNITANPGVTIIVVSLAINLLVLPLYLRADALQEDERDIQRKLEKGVTHIKKTFKGDERLMILQTYYRKNQYHPLYVLRGAAPLFLEIPFFIAAYSFLSGLQMLRGVSFGPIPDLGSPDGMLTIAGQTVNLLPILMTLINIISSAIFTQGHPFKTKLQLYGMALIFLVLLYDSPAGLVFYWTLNNLFSLVKTVFYKLKDPGMVLKILAFVAGIVSIAAGSRYIGISIARIVFFTGAGLLLMLPLTVSFLGRFRPDGKKKQSIAPAQELFIGGASLLTMLTGLMIPASVIKASPLEFVNIGSFYDPLWFVVSSFCLSAGLFLIWVTVFYKLASDKNKVRMETVICILSPAAVADYLFFAKNLGILTVALKYKDGMSFTLREELINLAVLLAVSITILIISHRYKKFMMYIFILGTIAGTCLAAINIYQIHSEIKGVKARIENGEGIARIPLSRSGKNVVVMMLDRALGEYIPYIMEEKPELMSAFSGFTYYSNTISFGGSTNFGAPPLFGGYDYTPEKMNLRSEEPLADKHNEALKVLPKFFSDNGYDVTVCDPPYAGYYWIPDLSIYDDIPGVKAYITDGAFIEEDLQEAYINMSKRNFFCYALTKSMPLFIQPSFYEGGNYHSMAPLDTMSQGVHDKYTADGYEAKFMQAYAVLDRLDELTEIKEDDKGSFIMMANYTSHEPMLLQKNEYEVLPHVDNTEYGEEDRHSGETFGASEERILHMDEKTQVTQYHCNMAAYLKLAEWFDYLRANGLYDNTRIILVADHGEEMRQVDELFYTCDNEGEIDLSAYYPLLMVKDYDEKEFQISEDFMTNADAASLAVRGVTEDPCNPYTGNPMEGDKSGEQYILRSDKWKVEDNHGNTFLPGTWLSIHDNIWDIDNWKVVSMDSSLPLGK